jgi:hypothetical protein
MELSHQLCSYSRISQHFMEPEDSLLCSQEPSIGPNPKPDQSIPHHPILSKMHFNTVYPPMSWSSQWSLSFWLSHQCPMYESRRQEPCACYKGDYFHSECGNLKFLHLNVSQKIKQLCGFM